MARWTERNRWRRGKWLVRDDESGFVEYSDRVVRRWDGLYVRKDQDEPIDPQWFIQADSDPKPVPFVRPDELAPPTCKTSPPFPPFPGPGIGGMLLNPDDPGFPGLRYVWVWPDARPPAPASPGTSVFVGTSIGKMEIECSFMVFPDSGPYPPA